ncbi:MAG: VOC family protein [Paracoccaceae bacterium]|nr:VOC family protein [Paracoccaceae bacterium]
MTKSFLEHVNITVSDPLAAGKIIADIFGWDIRWQGEAISGGMSCHVGNAESYIAFYSKGGRQKATDRYETPGALNHVGVVVDDLEATEKRVRAAGYASHSHADYVPGRRFYFDAMDGVEFEVVSYA